jgi:hypothetical protein
MKTHHLSATGVMRVNLYVASALCGRIFLTTVERVYGKKVIGSSLAGLMYWPRVVTQFHANSLLP